MFVEHVIVLKLMTIQKLKKISSEIHCFHWKQKSHISLLLKRLGIIVCS